MYPASAEFGSRTTWRCSWTTPKSSPTLRGNSSNSRSCMKGKKKRGKPTDITVSGVDLSQLERLLAFMSEHGLEEFEYSHGDLRIRLKKPAINSNPLSQRPVMLPEIVVAGPAPSAAPA